MFTFLLTSLMLVSSVVEAQSPATPNPLTRAEAAMILMTSAGIPIPEKPQLKTADVFGNEWFVPYLSAALERRVIEKDARSGTLRPYTPVTRAEFLKMMSLTYGLPKDLPFPYADIARDAWYRPYVGIAFKARIFWNPADPLHLHPDRRITQEEAVSAINAVFGEAATKPASSNVTTILQPTSPKHPAASSHGTTARVKSNLAQSPSQVRDALLRFFAQDASPLDSLRLAILQRINAERRAAGGPILRHNSKLADAAQAHARDMETRGYFGHFTPEGLSYVDRIRAAGYLTLSPEQCPCSKASADGQVQTVNPNSVIVNPSPECSCTPRFAVGENIAKGQSTTKQVMDEWMASPSHRENILNEAFDEVGIGVFGDVWVEEFGRIEAQ